MKKIAGDILILHKCTKNHNHEVQFLRNGVRQKIFCHFGPFSAILPQKWKFGINVKKPLRYYPITHVHHKWRSYDVWFLRKAWQTTFFCNFGPFFPFDPSTNLKNRSFETMKKSTWRYHHFTIVYQKSWPYDILFLRYGAWQM